VCKEDLVNRMHVVVQAHQKEVGWCMHGFDGKRDACILCSGVCMLGGTTLGYLAQINKPCHK
jgi:hypothetical protein